MAAADTVKGGMKDIRVEKVVLNCSVGESGDRLTHATRMLKELTKQEPVTTAARYTVRGFGIRRNEMIAAHVTVRGQKALDILERGLKVKEYELKVANFSSTGNFGFGIDEHIDMGIPYNPQTGIFGLDVYVVLKRPGDRVSKRKRARGRVGKHHKVTQSESMEWFKKKYNGILM
mmetsp:Transcript_7581/g.19287  ORF Transcript_7581/g.19287 Transcript_7581/m.19287 type:complete len:175 (+) Transcript_7581:87-611(+)|eukprot:CAMPEP_0197592542 /NCGR_PEP_ID=MMETSP1326-20131121/15149_1 /TAXON_ID=1155430 /ORGANISM="Genus nov. species nov., Strain RCC2288" /LENGTH=174 /DNA_ID=CAMNT_0043158247 /DNA_START=87 /DNA_END=611 /DNA_ORIENTATION=-